MEKKASSGSAPLAALALALSLLACALGTGALPDAAFAEEPNAVLNVPTTVPCAVKADGSVVTPGNWSITNEGNRDAALGDVTATDPIDGLSLRASSGSPATEWFSLAGGTVATAKRDTLAAGAAYPVSWAVGKLDPVKNASTLAQAATAPARMATLSFTYTLVPRPQAFAVYSADDNSLTFYKRANVPAADQMFEGKTATEVYEGAEKASYTAADGAPWARHAAELASVTVADEGIAPVSTAYWFNGASKLRSVDIAALDTSKTTCMDGMFQGCSSLESLDLSAMSTRRVASMTAFLGGCDSLTELSIGSEFAWVGDDCYPPTGNWKQGSTGTDYSESQIPANKTDKYTRVKTAFAVYSADDQSLTFYKRFEVPATGTVFEGKSATEIFSGFETDKYPFASSVPWFGHAADIASVAVADVGIAPKSTGYWFNKMTSLKSADISKLNASNVTNMYSMFSYCGSLTNLDLSSFDTRNVANMSYMFDGCNTLMTLDLSSFDTSKVATMGGLFSNCDNLTTLDLSSFNTSTVTNMYSMFFNCKTLKTLNLSSFDTINVTNMRSMFTQCYNLTTLDLSSFNTGSVTDMSSMFYDCNALTTLDLSSFDTSKVKNMSSMFGNCKALQEVALGVDWKWVGTNGYLPTPSSSYIAGADRKWHAESDGAAYAPADIPDGKADTYVASKELLPGPLTGTVSVSGDPIVGSALAASVSGMQSAAVPSCEWYAGRPGQVSEHVAFPATEEVTMTINVTEAPSTLSFENVKGLSSAQSDQSGIALCAAEGGEPYVKVTAPDGTSVAAVGSGSWKDPVLYDRYNYCSPSFELAQSRQYSVTFTWMWKDTIQPDGGIPCQFDMVYQGSVSSLVGTGSTYTPTSADVGATVSCKVSDASGRYSGHIEGAASGPVSEPKTAFAVYSADDDSLSFYKRAGVPKAGDQFEGKAATAVYTGIETDGYGYSTYPWKSYASSIKSAAVVDDGVAPASTACWFYNCSKMTSCDVSQLNTSKVTDMRDMFSGCSSLASLDVSNFDTSKVTNMSRMFNYCSKLTTLDVSGWNTSKVTNMTSMFYCCFELSSLNVSNFDTSKVTSMSSMFQSCSELAVNCSTWSVSSVTEHDYFNDGAPGVVPPAWPSSDEEAPDDAIAPTGQEDAAASGSDEGAATEDETSTSSDTAGASGEEEDDGSASGESASGSATGEGDGSESPDGGDSGAAPIEGKLEDEGEELPV